MQASLSGSKHQEIIFTLPKIKVIQESRKAFDQGYRIIVNQGGTRSGKTFSLTQYLICLALTGKYSISVCSVAFPHLRKGAMRDWRKIMEDYKLYDPGAHMKTEQLYTYPTGSYVEFFSVDNQLKVRGPGRDILFINEANIIQYETFRQLLLRTKKAIFIDYNPADEFHWLYDKVLNRPDCYFIKSTYRDNPFLPKEQIAEIESYKDADPNFWRIYGEGERGHSEGVIYTHWNTYSGNIAGSGVYGLDFGYNNPTSLVRITENDKNLYAKEEFYQSRVTNSELIQVLKQIVKPGEVIFCDAAEPQRIEEIRRAGIQARAANKDVKAGIDFIKSRKLFIDQGSANLLKEIKSYKYKTPGNKVANTPEEPLKLNDHAMDAMRYAAISFKKPKSSLSMTFHK
jgi:phage terminase large subunit